VVPGRMVYEVFGSTAGQREFHAVSVPVPEDGEPRPTQGSYLPIDLAGSHGRR